MINVFAKESRLIIIFFLTVIVLGSLLVYLSINNISNYKELTEKKISEEQHELADQFSVIFQNQIKELVATFEEVKKKNSHINNHYFIDTIQGIEQIISIDQNGAYLWPHFVFVNNNNVKKENSTKLFLAKIKAAEHSEFVNENYKRAIHKYLLAFSDARSKSDSAHVFNAISRLYVKLNQPEKAFDNYAIIISQFGNATNSSGFPYAYFSISQLLKVNDSVKTEAKQNLLISFLTNLSEGKISLNYNTSDLLKRISVWMSSFEKNESTIKIEGLIQKVSDYLLLINNYETPIEEILNGEDFKTVDLPIGNYKVLKPLSTITDEVLLFDDSSLNAVGFTIRLEVLFDMVNRQQIQKKTRFEYQIELIKNNGQIYLSNNYLINFSEFSTYFKEYRIKIELRNKNVVEQYVIKRKMIYGIGFVLLIGVMSFGLVLMVQNVKRKKQMERLRADFVSNVSHELKTPLTSIHMFAESIFLGRAQSTTVLKKYANIIVKESENLQRMINNILEFSRKENDKLEFEIHDANLSEIINSTVSEMNYWLKINKFKVILEIQPDIIVKVNSEGIKQVLSNLISNAIKYSSRKKKLIIRLIKKKKTVLIEVEDFGIGIKEDKLERIFDKFYRVNSEGNESKSGTGLGLTVTKNIIEAQNGKIFVESTFGKGSKFTIILK